MKKAHCLLLFLLVPQFVYAVFFIKDHDKILDKMMMQWNRHNVLLEQFVKLPNIQGQCKNIQTLEEAIYCCQMAVQYCDKILEKIEAKAKSDRKSWADIKKLRKADKKRFEEEMSRIRALIDQVNMAGIVEIGRLYQEGLEKGTVAASQVAWVQDLSQEDVEGNLKGLRQAIASYNEAIACFQQAALLPRNHSSGMQLPTQESVAEVLNTYLHALETCQQMEWQLQERALCMNRMAQIENLYQKGLKNGRMAVSLVAEVQQHPQNAEGNLEPLEQAIAFYNEAIACFQQAVLLPQTDSFGMQLPTRDNIVDVINDYQRALEECQQLQERTLCMNRIAQIENLYQKGLEKGGLAAAQVEEVQLQPQDGEGNLERLRQAIVFYNEAIACFQQVLLLPHTYAFGPQLPSQDDAIEILHYYLDALEECQQIERQFILHSASNLEF